jgi:hypothetical protein
MRGVAFAQSLPCSDPRISFSRAQQVRPCRFSREGAGGSDQLPARAGGRLRQISSNSTRPNGEFRRGPGYSDGAVETARGGLSCRPTRIGETRTGLVVTPVVSSAPGMRNCRVVAHAKVEYTAPTDVDRSGSSCSQADTGVGFGLSHLGSREDRRRSCDRLSRRGPHASRHRLGGVVAHSTFPALGSIRVRPVIGDKRCPVHSIGRRDLHPHPALPIAMAGRGMGRL